MEKELGGRARNITAKDLDGMLADYVDPDECSVELVRRIRGRDDKCCNVRF